MAPNTDPPWPATPGQGAGQASEGPGEQPDDRPAWLASGQGTTILEPPKLPSGYDSTSGWAYQSSPEGERPWEQNPHTWGEPAPQSWGEPAAEATVPLSGAAWEAPADRPPRDQQPNRWRRGLALAVAGLVLIAAGFGASSLTQTGSRTEESGGVPALQGGPGPVQSQSATNEPVAAVAEALIPSVVNLDSRTGASAAIGSGVIYDSNGYILTAAHVVQDASTVNVRMSDGNSFQGEVLGADVASDIGVVKIDATGLPAATLATGVDLQVGQMAVAIGSPFGLQDTVTAGIVSGLNRTLQVEGGGSRTVLQTDAPINPGNSGGALADREGRVIGINSAIRPDAESGGNIGVGFAVPVDTAARVAAAIVQGQPVETTFVGIGGDDSPIAAGALVQEVEPGSPAEAAGLQVGDLVTAFDGEAIGSFNDLVAKTREGTVGQTVTLTIVRDGQEQSVEVTLGAKPG